VAEGPEGQVNISCKTCILACGSWINNKEVVERCFPQFAAAQKHMGVSPHTNPNYTGDGFKLVEGLDTEPDEKNFTLRLMGPMVMIRNEVLGSMSNSPFAMVVNQNAKRYICEPPQLRAGIFNAGLVQMEQPEGRAYILFDTNNLDAAIRENKERPPQGNFGIFGPPRYPDTLEEAEAQIRAEQEKGSSKLVVAETVEELAEQLGLEPQALREEIDRYNSYCERGFDSTCFKDSHFLVPMVRAPYYALRADLGTDGAFGGVLVNENMQALRKDGSLVEGLYVTGDFASGRFINQNGVKVQLLNDMSWALASGFLAGTNAVKA
jgi:fumarate reductase flavoprotein subunit